MTGVEENLATGSSTGQCRRLADVLTATRSMLEHASTGEWEEVAKLERVRRDDLQACFSEAVAPEHNELVSEALAVMLHLNEELMDLLGSARDAVLEQGAQQARTRSAVDSYKTIQHG